MARDRDLRDGNNPSLFALRPIHKRFNLGGIESDVLRDIREKMLLWHRGILLGEFAKRIPQTVRIVT